MAFGKDESQLQDIPTFRQSAHAQQAARPANSGPRAAPYFVNNYKPSMDSPDTIRILRGAYDIEIVGEDHAVRTMTAPYVPYVEHFHGGLKKGFLCSAGTLHRFRDKREPCLGCDMYWEDKMAKRNGAMSKREMYAFSVIHFAKYAKVEQIDRATGQVRIGGDGTPYWQWVRVLPHEKAKYAGREQKDAHLLHWSIGFGHWNVLLEFDREIGRSCNGCGTRDSIVTDAWVCRHCEAELINPNDTTMNPKELESVVMKPVRCGNCGEVALLQEAISCGNCASPQRAELFDVDLNLKRVASPQGGNKTDLIVTSWSNPRPVDQRFADLLKPLDLKAIFSPTPVERQQELLGAAAAGRQPVTAGAFSKPYGGPPTLGSR